MVKVYSTGIFYCSVCTDEEPGAMLEQVNMLSPAGTAHGWKIAEEPFKSGEPNPSPCNDKPETHKHYLLDC